MLKALAIITTSIICLFGSFAYANAIPIQNNKTASAIKAETFESCVDNCMDGILRAKPTCEAQCASKK